MKKSLYGIIIFTCLIGLQASASENIGTVINGSQYAWGENIGWVNFAPKTSGNYSGLTITDNAVTGYAWSSILGWINFSPTNSGQGVTNTPSGQLGGNAWISGLGWLSMNGVTINSVGKFTGVAGTEGSSVGRVSFDCNHCDVLTDWRPVSSRAKANDTNTITGGGSISTNQIPPPVLPPDNYIKPKNDSNSNSAPVSITSESISKDNGGAVGGSGVNVSIPAGAFPEDLKINISKDVLTPTNAPSPDTKAFLIGGIVFNVSAIDSHGKSVHKFNKKIKIVIDIPTDLLGEKDLGAYYLDESDVKNLHWVLIPSAVFSNGKVTIEVDHLTRFAIFKTKDSPRILPVLTNGTSKSENPFMWILLIALILFIVVIYTTLKRQQSRP